MTPAIPNRKAECLPGTLAEAGAGVADFAVGDRVAVGWFGGYCAHCVPCRSGALMHCENGQRPGREYPGGYAESVTVPANALARIPDELSFAEAAPMGCAGVTTYNALRHASASPGDRVAVLGIGGLGHLGVQFARAMGLRRWRSRAAPGKKSRPASSVPTIMSIPPRVMSPRRCRRWAVSPSCWPLRAPRRSVRQSADCARGVSWRSSA